MNNNKLMKTVIIVVSLLLAINIINNIFFPMSISYDSDKVTIISSKNNVIYVNYSQLNSFLNNVNEYLDYGEDLEVIYNNIIDKFYNDDKAKMYDEGGYKVLELQYDKIEAKKLFNNYVSINQDVTVKVLFDKNEKIDNINLDEINLKINREQVIRERIVKLAQEQLGNTGEKYWTWYGFNHRVEWCCVFVSWLANQNGVLNKAIPKFIWVKKGVDYYKERNRLRFPNAYTPKPGDVIFFDWNNNLVIDHVGIVEKVEKGYVYSIEGNVGLKDVQRRKSKLTAHYIYGYGVPEY